MSQIRSIAQIQQSIIDSIQADPTLGPLLTSTSSVSQWNLWTYIVATAEALEEQLAQVYQQEVDLAASKIPPATAAWIQNKAFEFQYSSTNPQIIQLDTTTFAPYWPEVNASYRIITRCSVTPGSVGNVNVKIATGSTPAPLSSPQLTAFKSYMDYIKPCGISYAYITAPSDKLFVQSSITVNGAYSSTISASLLTAYNNYLANLPFNGQFILSDLEVALKSVPGVIDVEFVNVHLRTDATAFPTGGPFNMVNNIGGLVPPGTLISPVQLNTTYNPFSGYIEDEGTVSPTGYDFLSNITFTYV